MPFIKGSFFAVMCPMLHYVHDLHAGAGKIAAQTEDLCHCFTAALGKRDIGRRQCGLPFLMDREAGKVGYCLGHF